MKRLPTLLAVLGLTAGIAAWHLHLQQTSERIPPPDPPGAGALASPNIDFRFLSATEPTVEEPATENGAPLGANCVYEWKNGLNGTLVPKLNCSPDNREDPYELMDNDTLASMAYGDARAAEELGLRYIRSEDRQTEAKGLGLIVRAVALSGDPNAFRSAIGARYAYLSVNGEPQIDNMKHQLVFNLIGEALGDDRFNSAQVLAKLRGIGVPEPDIRDVTDTAHRLLERMADLQTDVTGNSSIREALENA